MQLYRTFYLHFVSRIERPLLETLAHDLVKVNAASLISKIYDQYLDVIALEPSLFTLNIKNSFVAYNNPNLGEQDIRSYMSQITMGLISTIRVLGSLPIIRASSGGPAEMLANDLCTSLRENLSPRGGAHTFFSDFLVTDRPRPLLLIFDRTCDMALPLTHSSSYQSLVDDLLDFHLNKVVVEVTSASTGTKRKTYDLNTEVDQFLAQFAGAPFPEAVEANEVQLAEATKRESEIRSRPVADAAEAMVALNPSGRDLSAAISMLPEILAKKANLEAHTNILQAVMKEIAAREVPTYFETEQGVLQAGSITDKTVILDLLRDPTKGNLQDKTRLFAISALLSDVNSKLDEYEAAFQDGCSSSSPNNPVPCTPQEISAMLGAVSFIKRLQKLQTPMSRGFGGSSGAGSSGGGSGLSSMLGTVLHQRATSLMAKAASFFTKFSPVYITRVVDNLSEGKNCAEDDSYGVFDPRARANELVDIRGQKFSEVIVFVVGGGCYTEYFNLQELLKQKATSPTSVLKNIIYGGTELLSSKEFLRQLNELAVISSGGAKVGP